MLLHLEAELCWSLSAPEGGIRLITTMKGEQQLVSDSLQDVNKFIWYIVDKNVCYLHRPFCQDQCMVFDHGVDVEAVYWHQVQVTELVRSGGDAEREGVLRVHKQDAGRPVPSLDQGQEVLGIIGGQIESVDYVEIILRYMKSYFHLSESL